MNRRTNPRPPPRRKSSVIQGEKKALKKQVQLFKRTLDYEHDVPRCGTCVHYSLGHCDKHQFGTTPVALCRDWRDALGCTLEP